MAKIKNYYYDLACSLAQKTKYDADFLFDKLLEVLDEDGDIDYFIGVTLEQDW